MNIAQIGLNDNFFEIGGDSISSIRIISKAKNYGLKIKPDQIFQYQTIADLAKNIENISLKDQKPFISFTGESKLAPIQHWFFEMFRSAPHYWNLSCKNGFSDN